MVEQRSPEWYEMRLGKVTASRVSDMLARTKSGWGASRANYCAELVAERLTGAQAERYSNDVMARGSDLESEARAAYEFYASATIEPVDFVPHPTIPMAGASPDGLVGEDGLIEMKIPNTATHIETLLGGSVPSKYILQMQWQLACTGRAWADFVSYDPRMPEEMRLFIRRIQRDPAKIVEITAAVAVFLREVDDLVIDLTKRYRATEAA